MSAVWRILFADVIFMLISEVSRVQIFAWMIKSIKIVVACLLFFNNLCFVKFIVFSFPLVFEFFNLGLKIFKSPLLLSIIKLHTILNLSQIV